MPKYSQYKPHYIANLKLAGPIMLGQIGQLTVNLADNIMVGKLGAVPLAAVALSISIYISLVVAGMGLSFALPPLIAEAEGKENLRGISQYFKHSLLINVIYAIICVLILELVIPLLPRLGQDPRVVELAIPYIRISAWTMIPLMIFQTLRCYADGLSETKPAMIAILIGNVVNIGANYILIFGKFGAPALGVKGAALGTLGARIFMIIVLVYILKNWKSLWDYIKEARYNFYQLSLVKKILGLGIPTGLQLFFEVSAFGGAALIMGMIGAKPQAAHQIAINLASVTFLICTGLGMAATVRIGNHVGRGDRQGVRDAGFSAMIQVIFFMIIAALLFISTRHLLPYIYISDPEVVQIASLLLIFAAVFQVSDGVQVVALGMLRGLQDVKAPTLITFVSYWIFGLPISYITAIIMDFGPGGVWIGLVVGLTLSAILLTYRFHRKTALNP